MGILQWTRNFGGSLRIYWGKLASCPTTDVLNMPWSYLILMSLVSGMYPSNFKVWIRRMVRRFKWRCKNWVIFVQAFGRECYLGFGACDGPRNVRLFCWSFGKLTWKWTLKMMVCPCHCMLVYCMVHHGFCFLAKCWHLFSSNQNGWQGTRPQNVAHVSRAGSLALVTQDLFAGGWIIPIVWYVPDFVKILKLLTFQKIGLYKSYIMMFKRCYVPTVPQIFQIPDPRSSRNRKKR